MLSKLIPGYGLLASVALAFVGAFMSGDTTNFYGFIALLLMVFGVWGGIMLIKKEECCEWVAEEKQKRAYTKRK